MAITYFVKFWWKIKARIVFYSDNSEHSSNLLAGSKIEPKSSNTSQFASSDQVIRFITFVSGYRVIPTQKDGKLQDSLSELVQKKLWIRKFDLVIACQLRKWF